MDVIPALTFRLLHFHHERVGPGIGILSNPSHLPGDLEAGRASGDPETVALNFLRHVQTGSGTADRRQLVAEISIQGFKPRGQLHHPCAAFCTPLPELSLMLMEDLRGPAACGVKVAWSIQLLPAASVLGEIGQVCLTPKSLLFAPANAMLLIVNGRPLLLVRVIVPAALGVVRSCVPKNKELGESDTVGLTTRLTMAENGGSQSDGLSLNSPGWAKAPVWWWR